jgi:hypothetical protein
MANKNTIITKDNWQVRFLNAVFYGMLNEMPESIQTTVADIEMAENLIYEAMSDLTDTQTQVLERRLMASTPDSLQTIGEALTDRTGNDAREWARRVEAKALRKLRYPSRSVKIHGLVDELNNGTYNVLEFNVELRKKELERAEFLLKVNRGNPEDLRVEDGSVEDLDLSVRAINCLKRADIKSVGELVTAVREGRTIRNLGEKCLDEIKNKLVELGYTEFA